MPSPTTPPPGDQLGLPFRGGVYAPAQGQQVGLAFVGEADYTPAPGSQVAMPFTGGPYTPPPGNQVGLGFGDGQTPPQPVDTYLLQPGGSLPVVQLVAFGGQAAGRYVEQHSAILDDAVPQHLPTFGGVASGFYAERHTALVEGSLPAALGDFAGRIDAPYDSRVQRPLARLAQGLRFEQAARASAAVAAVFQEARRASAQVRDVVQQAQTLAAQVQSIGQQAQALRHAMQDTAQQARPLRLRSASAFEAAQALRHALQEQARQARRLPLTALVYRWQIADPRRGLHLERFEQAGIQRDMGLQAVPPVPPPAIGGHGPWQYLPLPPGFTGYNLGLDLRYPARQPIGLGVRLEFAPQFITPRTWAELQTGPHGSSNALAARLQNRPAAVRWQDAMRPGPATVKVPWPPEGGGTDPGGPGQPGQTVVITAKKVYIVQNEITLIRLDTGAELQAHSFGMSLDYQSWTWSWQASLHHSAAAHLGRDAQGDPAELLATVNGVPFRLRLERVARDRRHLPQVRYSVSGKGRAAILDAPWAPQMQFGNPDGGYTALQLALNALTINGMPIGWGIDWRLDDWLVPQGAWAMQGSYIAAINDIASAAGGYVQPHNTDAVLRILHKYPAAPWEWGDVTPDFEIPAALAEVESTEYLDKPVYNRVFVGGVGTGVFGPVTRAGTAGHQLAPQATHPLITAAEAWRQRGRAELADTGRQERIRISLPVLPETGVITPGQFVRYRGEQETIGIVRGTSIDWQRPRLRQTLEIEAHEPV